MDIDSIFATDYHKSVNQFNSELLQQWKLFPLVKFPYTKFITDGDEFFKNVWQAIDNSKDYFWITTFAMDQSPAGSTTLRKLIQAAKRGVHVIVYIDYTQVRVDPQLLSQLKQAGGKCLMLNPLTLSKQQSISKYFSKDIWRRHHEKLIVSDDCSIIGSANIEGRYAGIRYGTMVYRDTNLYSQNIILDEFRQHFVDTANFYSFDLKTGEQNSKNVEYNNEQILKTVEKKHQNSKFYPVNKYKLLRNNQKTRRKEIEQDILQRIKLAKNQIKIITPYHYSISKFDRRMRGAIFQRGLTPEIITTGKRGQPMFQSISNEMLFENLLKKGVKLYETKQGELHSKVYMFDRRWVNMGSMNNDRWSWAISNECNIIIDDPRVYEEVDSYFEILKKECRRVQRGYQITSDQAVSIGFWQWFLYFSEMFMSQSGRPEEDYILDTSKNS